MAKKEFKKEIVSEPVQESKALPPKEESRPPAEKLQNVVGWKPIDTAEKDFRKRIKVSAKPEGEGTLVYWKKTREMINFQWVPAGKWADSLTHRSLNFEPKYWKEA